MKNNSKFIIQSEIGESSWFGFSLILQKEYENQREFFVDKLEELGFVNELKLA